MTQVFIYKNDDGSVTVGTVPSDSNEPVGQVAAKATPTGKPFKIADSSDLPEDRSFRESWTIADSELTDGFGV